MMKRTLLVLIGTICFSSPSLCFGADAPIQSPTSGDTERIPGKPLRWTWKDGRAAMMLETTGPLVPLTTTLTMTKNTCTSAPAPKCYLKSMIRQRVFAIVWERHPKKANIGNILQKVDEDGRDSSDITDRFYINSYLVTDLSQKVYSMRGYKPQPMADVEDLLVCDHFDWLPNARLNKQVNLESWGTQFEFSNDQIVMASGGSESVNQMWMAAHGVEMTWKSPKELKIDKIRTANTLLDFGVFGYVFAYTSQMQLDRSRHGVSPEPSQGRVEWSDPNCRIEFTHNFTEVFTQLNNFTAINMPRPQVKDPNSKPVLYDPLDPHIKLDPTGIMTNSVMQ